MNDELSTDQRQLEQATARKLSGSNVVAQETLATREAWLALGKATETAGAAGLDQAALLASLQNELCKSPAAIKAPELAPVSDWSWIAVAVAAVLLIAATIVGALSQRPESIPAHVPQFVGPTPQPAVKSPQSVAPEPLPTEGLVASEPPTTSWNDLDEEISTTYTALQQMGQTTSGVDRSLTDFDSQLKQLSADIAGESL